MTTAPQAPKGAGSRAQAAPNKLGLQDEASLEVAEAVMTSVRISELVLTPIHGSFDAAHLVATHLHIMQDLYEHAGQFRPAGPNAKLRGLSDGSSYRVDYSAQADLPGQVEAALEDVRDRFKGLAISDDVDGAGDQDAVLEEIAKRTAALYSELDYAHPFQEGNSRTLRAFVSQLLLEATGMKLRWASAQAEPADRDRLYMARDKAILPRALKEATSERTMFNLSRSMSRVKAEPDLATVILAGLRPAASCARLVEVDASQGIDEEPEDSEHNGAQRHERCRC